MRFSIFISLPILCSFASAVGIEPVPLPAVPETSTGCPAQAVLDTCLSSTTAIAMSCALTDYACLCQKNTDVLTCFNNCPNDPRLSAARSTQASYCANASAYPSSTAIVPSGSVTPVTSSSTSAISTSTLSGTHSASSSTSASTGSSTSASASATPTNSEKSDSNKVNIGVPSLLMVLLTLLA